MSHNDLWPKHLRNVRILEVVEFEVQQSLESILMVSWL